MGYSMDDDHTIHMVCGPGGSGYTAHQFGQEAVCIAQALSFAGYPTKDPVFVIAALNNKSAWTDDNHVEGPGLIDWGRVQIAIPQVLPGGNQFSLVQGRYGRFNHTLLLHDDVYFDPKSGQDNFIPAGFVPNGRIRTFNIRRAV